MPRKFLVGEASRRNGCALSDGGAARAGGHAACFDPGSMLPRGTSVASLDEPLPWRGAADPALAALAARLLEGGRLISVEALGADGARDDDATRKGAGYGRPLRLGVAAPDGTTRQFVLRTANADDFGHDRRADRAQEILLAYDTGDGVPRHARPLEVGAVIDRRGLLPLVGAGELYLVTEFAPGALYAGELRELAARTEASPRDHARVDALADYLVALHGARGGREAVYVRAARDLLGSGEGIFGVVDAYPDGTPAAPAGRLRALERAALEWRWKLKRLARRLTRTHGDFHPFNILFDGDELWLLDTSRGSAGEPADDVTALAVNYPFFALAHPGSWARGFGPLWRRLWARYLQATGDDALLEVAAPFLAWRALVVCCPRFYPSLAAEARDALLGLAERALAAPAFDPAWAEELFT
jgi:aminoglycoside phosphotransferase (APT) family kinase protein